MALADGSPAPLYAETTLLNSQFEAIAKEGAAVELDRGLSSRRFAVGFRNDRWIITHAVARKLPFHYLSGNTQYGLCD